MTEEQRLEAIGALDAVAEQIKAEWVKRELQAVVHKLRFPMADILAKVPGKNLSARARAIGVSRQTMYIWQDERFRPTAPQARQISKLTGVPEWQIVDDGFEDPRHPS